MITIHDLLPAEKSVFMFGEVEVVSPLEVRVNGADTASTGFLSLSSYTPVLNDTVIMARVGNSWIILGAL